jgi:hypothetical protein
MMNEKYPKRLCSIKQKDAETKADLGKEGISMLSGKRLKCVYREPKYKRGSIS